MSSNIFLIKNNCRPFLAELELIIRKTIPKSDENQLLEMNRLEYDTSQNSEYNVYIWEILKENKLPGSLPTQRDSSSCGIFVAMTAFYWYKFNRLPHYQFDWNENDVNSSTPDLRIFVLHFIITTIYNKNTRTLDLTNN